MALLFRPLCPQCGRRLITLRRDGHPALLFAEPLVFLTALIIALIFGLTALEGVLLYLAIGMLVVAPFAIAFAIWYERHDQRARFHCPVCLGNFGLHELAAGR
jgi:predicted outer membrane lipoprotein